MSNLLAIKSQTFDLDKNESSYLNVIKILYSCPRLYDDLVLSLESKEKGFTKTLVKLKSLGFVEYQPPVVVNTITGLSSASSGKPVKRFILSSKGRKALKKYEEDVAYFSIDFKKIDQSQTVKILELLKELRLEPPHSRYGLSVTHLTKLLDMPQRSIRWWIELLVNKGYVEELLDKYADTRALIPGHYRVTKKLSKQLELVVLSYPTDRNINLSKTLKIKRNKYLSDIKIARVGISGATDYDHDIDTQRILSKMVLSSSFVYKALLDIEPRITIPVKNEADYLVFNQKGGSVLFYQPDAIIKEKDSSSQLVKSVLEYERFQTRKDGWEHIEKFIGFIYINCLPFEKGVLRFVVDGKQRLNTYVKLIEAFTDSVMDNPELLPLNPISIKVTTLQDIEKSTDALTDDIWFSIDLPTGLSSVSKPRVHKGVSPYSDYFSRGRQW